MFFKNSLNMLLLPAIVLAGAFALLATGPVVPAPAQGVTPYIPYVMALVAAGLGMWFKRVRVLLLALLIAAAHWVLQSFSFAVNPQSDEVRVLYAALTVALPVNVLLVALMRDCALMSAAVLSRLLFFTSQFAITLVVWSAGPASRAGADAVLHWRLLDRSFDQWTLLPQPAIWLFVGVTATLLGRVAVTRSPIDAGAFSAAVASAIALHGVAIVDISPLLLSIAGLALTVSVVQDIYRMAFIDELTGLAQRRALMMDLAAARGRAAVAMLDVDHFKKFNDSYGHDVGDQVLKLVASRMMRVTGGGKPYRYGGEEFTVLFPGKTVDQALPHLEALRKSIAEAVFFLRGDNRPKAKPEGAAPPTAPSGRGSRRDAAKVSVTISIGVAGGGEQGRPDDTLKAADQALYRAKKAGRNRVAR